MKESEQKPAWQRFNYRNSKERIIIGASIAFSKKGFYGTSVREISREAGLEQPSIYHHFRNKENLYRVSLRAVHLYMLRIMSRKIEKGETLLKEVRSIFRAISWFHNEHPEFFNLLFKLIYSSPRDIADSFTLRYGSDIFIFVDRAFRRNPPASAYRSKYSLTVHTLYSYLLAYTGSPPQNKKLSFYTPLRKVFREL